MTETSFALAYETPPADAHWRSVLVILCNGVSDLRMQLAARELNRAGYYVQVVSTVLFHLLARHDLVICSRPGIQMCDLVMLAVRAGLPVVVDVDDDFHSIPPHNPAYSIIGKGAPNQYLARLQTALFSATRVTVPSPVVAERYAVKNAVVIPNSWDEECPHWAAPKLPTGRDYVALGWAGTNTHARDFALCYDGLRQVLAEHPEVRLVIGGDPAIYFLFSDLPENRRLFLWGMPYADYPMMLRYADVWLAPLEDTHFNRAKSDIRLMEAGARGIPWVASEVQPYLEWHDGGGFASRTEEWWTALDGLVGNPEVRDWLGAQGHAKALTRTAAEVGKQWVALAKELIG